MARLKLSLNQDKTSIKDARLQRFDFLGYSFGRERLHPPRFGWYLAAGRPRAVSGAIAGERGGRALPEQCGPVGGSGHCAQPQTSRLGHYFSYGTTWQSYWAADWYVCDRVRGFLQWRHKVPTRGTRRFSDQYIYGHLGVVSLRARWQLTA